VTTGALASATLALALCAGCVPDSPDAASNQKPSPKPAEVNSLTKRPVGAAFRPSILPSPSSLAQRVIAPPRAVPSATLAPAIAAPSALPPETTLTKPFSDNFDRATLGPDWNATSPVWRITAGRLCGDNAHNHPVWLRQKLPVNASIEFDATTTSPDGDIKAEYWGDGQSAAQTISYNAATSYLTIFGGWKNQFHVLARIDEHAKDRPELRIDDSSDDLRAKKVEPNRSYHFKVVRDDGKTVHWYVDDLEILSYPDPAPLTGPGHDHFGFNDWEVHLCFDNLVVTPLRTR